MEKTYSKIFVTVGTTDFDSLILALDTPDFFEFIRTKECKKLTVQYGRGTHVPEYLAGVCEHHNIDFECFRFKDSLDRCMIEATLIICHAGAGSITEALTFGKKVMVVVNETLMDNHQLELAEAVVGKGFCFLCYPNSLIESLHNAGDFSQLKKYEELNPDAFPALLDELIF